MQVENYFNGMRMLYARIEHSQDTIHLVLYQQYLISTNQSLYQFAVKVNGRHCISELYIFLMLIKAFMIIYLSFSLINNS